jgi:thiamine biosynthesis protein ThiS
MSEDGTGADVEGDAPGPGEDEGRESAASGGASAGDGGIAIQVNGEERRVPHGSTIADLLRALELVPGMVVVERNREIVDRSRYVQVEVEPGDVLELVHFVGGG